MNENCSNGGMVDTRDLKSLGYSSCVGSSPTSSTFNDITWVYLMQFIFIYNMKKFIFPSIVVMTAVLTSCGSKLGPLSAEYFTCTPQVLETVGGQVPVTISGTFPEKYMKKKAVVTVTPVLKYAGGEVKGEAATFQGEKVEANNQAIPYKVGGNYTMKSSYTYLPAMAKSELYLQFNAKVGKKQVEVPEVKIADGVIATSELVGQTLSGATTDQSSDAFQRVIKQAQEANILFLINRAELRAKELKSASVKGLKEQMSKINSDSTLKVDNIELSAYASPDGEKKFNEKLAISREKNTQKYLKGEMKKQKFEGSVDSKYTAEDWEGFQNLVSKSNVQDKDLILRVLSMYQDPEQREREIRNLSTVYGTLADEILPQLRRSRLTLNYEIIGKSDAELSQLAASNAKSLTLEELLYAATLTEDASKKDAIYKSVVAQYPTDYRAYNNLSSLAYQDGDYAAAANYANQAAKLNGSAAEVKVNQALVALKKGDAVTAERLLGNATSSKVAGEALGNLYLTQGKYQQAVASFGDTKTNSAALAQILTNDYNKAKQTLDAVNHKDAYTSYLGAILAARTNNASSALTNLKDAISQDSSLAQKAATDLEFSKLFSNSAFQSLVK